MTRRVQRGFFIDRPTRASATDKSSRKITAAETEARYEKTAKLREQRLGKEITDLHAGYGKGKR